MIVAVATSAASNIAAYPVLGTKAIAVTNDASQLLLVSQEDELSLLATTAARHRLRRLFALPENWDGHGSAKPVFQAVARAYRAVLEMYQLAALSGSGWTNPNVTADETGAVVLEWWRGPRKLTIYVTATEASYVRVWGNNIDTEMEDGPIDSIQYDFTPLWGWLNS
jgi:hypothetical protein